MRVPIHFLCLLAAAVATTGFSGCIKNEPTPPPVTPPPPMTTPSCPPKTSIGCPMVLYHIVDANTGVNIFSSSGLTADSVRIVNDSGDVNLRFGRSPYPLPGVASSRGLLLGIDPIALCSNPVYLGCSITFTKLIRLGVRDTDTLITTATYGDTPSGCSRCTNGGPLLTLELKYNGRLVRRFDKNVCTDSTDLFSTGRIITLRKRR